MLHHAVMTAFVAIHLLVLADGQIRHLLCPGLGCEPPAAVPVCILAVLLGHFDWTLVLHLLSILFVSVLVLLHEVHDVLIMTLVLRSLGIRLVQILLILMLRIGHQLALPHVARWSLLVLVAIGSACDRVQVRGQIVVLKPLNLSQVRFVVDLRVRFILLTIHLLNYFLFVLRVFSVVVRVLRFP